MKILIVILWLAAAACLAAGAWLLVAAWGLYYRADAYAPRAAPMTGHSAGGVEADGGGIFLPGGLVLAVGLFIARFAFSLWRAHQADARRQAGERPGLARHPRRRR